MLPYSDGARRPRSRDLGLAAQSRATCTAENLRAQMLSERFFLTTTTAKILAPLIFGEARP